MKLLRVLTFNLKTLDSYTTYTENASENGEICLTENNMKYLLNIDWYMWLSILNILWDTGSGLWCGVLSTGQGGPINRHTLIVTD